MRIVFIVFVLLFTGSLSYYAFNHPIQDFIADFSSDKNAEVRRASIAFEQLNEWQIDDYSATGSASLLSTVNEGEETINSLSVQYTNIKNQYELFATKRFLEYCVVGFEKILGKFTDVWNVAREEADIYNNLLQAYAIEKKVIEERNDEVLRVCMQRAINTAQQGHDEAGQYATLALGYYQILVELLNQQKNEARQCIERFPVSVERLEENIQRITGTLNEQIQYYTMLQAALQSNNLDDLRILCDNLDRLEQAQEQRRREQYRWRQDFDDGIDQPDADDESQLLPFRQDDEPLLEELHKQADDWIDTMTDVQARGTSYQDLLDEFFQDFYGSVDE